MAQYVTEIEAFSYFYEVNIYIVLSCFPQTDVTRASKLAWFSQLPWQKYYLWESMKHLLHVAYCATNDISPNAAVKRLKILINLFCHSIIINEIILCYMKYDRAWCLILEKVLHSVCLHFHCWLRLFLVCVSLVYHRLRFISREATLVFSVSTKFLL